MKRVSFDFDGTLTDHRVEQFCSTLAAQGYEVWITTLRFADEHIDTLNYPSYDNQEVYDCASRIGIKRQHIQFCNETGNKLPQLIDKDFAFHLDDDPYIIRAITQIMPHIIVDVCKPGWEKQCLERLADWNNKIT